MSVEESERRTTKILGVKKTEEIPDVSEKTLKIYHSFLNPTSRNTGIKIIKSFIILVLLRCYMLFVVSNGLKVFYEKKMTFMSLISS